MITTYTGKKFSFIDPQPEDICIEDIAHHLSLICRFNGACRVHYSVAQHSVLVAEMVPDKLIAQALLHDAGEAYYGDITSPFKRVLEAVGCDCCMEGHKFKQILERVDKAIFAKFNIPWPISKEIKRADNLMFDLEYYNFMHGDICIPKEFAQQGAMVPWASENAEEYFLNHCRKVGIK